MLFQVVCATTLVILSSALYDACILCILFCAKVVVALLVCVIILFVPLFFSLVLRFMKFKILADQKSTKRSEGGGYSSRKHAKEVPHLWFDITGNSRANVRIKCPLLFFVCLGFFIWKMIVL